jgi:hypothetical protein
MAKFFRTPWAESGDKEAIPDTIQGDGSVSYAQGEGVDYERAYDDPLAKDVSRKKTNQLRYDMTLALGEIQQHGVARWSADGKPYPLGVLISHGAGVFQSRKAGNNTTPAAGADWFDITNVLRPTDVLDALGTSAIKPISQRAVKAAIDALDVDVSVTGNATFSNLTNNIKLDGVGTIGLEIGDVVTIKNSALNSSEFTVEVITDANNVIVNAAHANGTTSKSLKNEAKAGVEVSLLAKWYNASDSLGRGYTFGKTHSTIYTNDTGRGLEIIVNTHPADNILLEIDGKAVARAKYGRTGADATNSASATVPRGATYRAVADYMGIFSELR